MFRGWSLTLFRVAGVPVRAHWTLVLALPYLAVVFALRLEDVARLSGIEPTRLVLPAVAWGLLVAVGLFASVTLHELVHTAVALRTGGTVRDITLLILGGVTQVERMPPRAATQGLMAAAGPAASLGLAALLWLALRLPLPPDLHLGVFTLAELNLVLGLFNLLPAFPMDGGRVLRALLTGRLGPGRATVVAATVGKVMAAALALAAIFMANILLLFIALFLFAGATAEVRVEELRHALADVRIGALATAPPARVGADATLAEALEIMREASRLDLVVVDERGAPLGIVRAADLSRLPASRRQGVRVHELGMRRLGGRGVEAAPDEPAVAAFERAAGRGAEYVFVVEPAGDGLGAGRLVGLVGRRELEDALALGALTEGRAAARGPFRPREV